MSITNKFSKDMRPTIINPSSSFVVITYWWGRGNMNKNTQRPCPDEVEENERLTRQPMSYDAMIKRWNQACKKSKCNYMSVEYPEFAQKGMYQRAINFKPAFVYQALLACAPRNVLYLDGDMLVKKYPYIFDTSNVDYMAQGWNIDSRFEFLEENVDKPCFFPYVYEVSGGTMFFSQSSFSKQLLKDWYELVVKHPTKAEDRLISLLINRQRDFLHLNTIQLPVEFLWLSLDYDYSQKKNIFDKSKALITHPECLTSEDRASSLSGQSNMNRYPRNYNRWNSYQVSCYLKKIPFYEYIFFDNKKFMRGFENYLNFMKKTNTFVVVPYDNKYGKYNKIAKANVDKIKMVSPVDTKKDIVYVTELDMKHKNAHYISNKYNLVPIILRYLCMGKHVMYVPKETDGRSITAIMRYKQYDLVCRNTNDDVYSRFKKEYYLKSDKQYPYFFNADSEVLHHLLMMSSNLTDFDKQFNSTFIFLSRMRCHWI